ncbi:MAG: FAD-binding protein [Anaerolineales bacterium]|nr:FAD-binding protein [Anaerolineales bacterium]
MLSTVAQVKTDVLIIGSGAAGARAAIEAAEFTAAVTLAAKGAPRRSGTTNLAGVHYAAALGHADEDTPWEHFHDTIVEARWLADQELARVMCLHGPKSVHDLERYGLHWYRTPDGTHYKQLPAPGHSFNRGVHYNGKTGKMVQDALIDEVKRHPNIHLLGDVFITQILVDDSGVVGAVGIHLERGELLAISTRSVVIATGGAGMVFKVTDMETGSTGDGIAMAFRAGADLIAPEMHQFFPTAFVWPETLRGVAVNSSQLWKLGLRLYNANDERFMERYYPEQKEHMPRDILSQCIFREITEGRGAEHGGVWLDTRWIEEFETLRRDRPRSYIWPEKLGVNVQRIEVAPTYHFTLGGIRINTEAETTIPGLYAAGEVVGATHGANRLAGNALTECLVFGEIAGRNAALRALSTTARPAPEAMVRAECQRLRGVLPETGTGRRPRAIYDDLRHAMYHNVGIVRDGRRLRAAVRRVAELREEVRSVQLTNTQHYNVEWIWALELDGMLELADLFATGAEMRTESRGAHYREDYPLLDNENWLKNILVRREGKRHVYWTEPVTLPYLSEVKMRYAEPSR